MACKFNIKFYTFQKLEESPISYIHLCATENSDSQDVNKVPVFSLEDFCDGNNVPTGVCCQQFLIDHHYLVIIIPGSRNS